MMFGDMVLVWILCLLIGATANEYPCDNDIYCHGKLLDTIQMSKIYTDSKSFVDRPLRWEPDQVKAEFDKLMEENDQKPSKEQLLKFVKENFYEPGEDTFYSSLEDVEEWKENPDFLNDITDDELRNWASELHKFWGNLTLNIKDDVKTKPNRYSLIYVPNKVVVPGDRFREFYYWDSYWTIRGLLLSEMFDTVKGMIANFVSMVKTYGFVPNGGRVYYTRRSQPPFLIPMMKIYIDETSDKDFLRENVDQLEREYKFWINNRAVNVNINGTVYEMARYNVEAIGPRPESYFEDVETAEQLENEDDKQELYKELKTVAETGWDFSTRWFIKDATNKGDLVDSKARSIVPVDLNSLLCMNAKILADFYERLDKPDKAIEYRKEAQRIDKAIHKVLWDEEVGAWLDYDIINKKRRNYFYMSNLNPLWTECYTSMEDKEMMMKKILKYLKEDTNAMDYTNGVPTSLKDSGQQWDFPNGWPPIQHMLIEGLADFDNKEANDLAFEIAQKWIGGNYATYKRTGHMFEKYHVSTGKGGSGGEYNVQLGFGWTNGVALDLLSRYGDKLKPVSEEAAVGAASIPTRFKVLLWGSMTVLVLLGVW